MHFFKIQFSHLMLCQIVSAKCFVNFVLHTFVKKPLNFFKKNTILNFNLNHTNIDFKVLLSTFQALSHFFKLIFVFFNNRLQLRNLSLRVKYW